jgi:hypothetical protein
MRLTYCKSGVALKRNGSLKRIRLGKQGQTAAAMVARHRIFKECYSLFSLPKE